MTLLEMTGLDEEAVTPSAAGGSRHVGQWRLARVELVNWGTFAGHHRIDVARTGHLFTGASGSGKSSLLDAIATVLTPDRWLRFNAAAQDSASRNDDRTLVSYVRGAWSKEADQNFDRAVSSYLRKTATWSGILLRFENDRDAPITLVRLFHLRGASVDKADLRDACVINRSELSLLDFREHVASGIEARRIKSAWPSAVVTTSGSHAPFYAKLMRLLGIDNLNALHLLHKTQSAKNLGSLDQLFRDFMLDEPATFARAKNAGEQFGELSQAHQHVVELRRQSEHLKTLDSAIVAYESAAEMEAEAVRLGELIDPFQNQLTLRLAADERGVLRSQRARAVEEERIADAALDEAAELLRAAERTALQLGGSDAAQVNDRVKDAVKDAAATAGRWQTFAAELASVGVEGAPTNGAEFAELVDSSRRVLEETVPTTGDREYADHEHLSAAKRELATIDGELGELRHRRSNLPAALLLARKRLAEELGLAETALPFAGELIEVLPEFAVWTGAIERVVFPLASALLVRDSYLPEVRRRVESRNLGARLVFEAVPVVAEQPRAARNSRSLLHRIRVSDGPFQDWLRARVAAEFDFVCVENADEFDAVERGVTIGGQVKKSARRYEKNDRHRIDDRSQWILGADNEAKIELLLERRRDAEKLKAEVGARLNQAYEDQMATVRWRTVLERVIGQEWSELDRTAAEERVNARRRQLAALTTGNIELQAARTLEDHARHAHQSALITARAAALTAGQVGAGLATVDLLISELQARLQDHPQAVPDADATLLEERYRRVQRKIDRSTVGEVGRKVSDALHKESTAALALLRRAESDFVAGCDAIQNNLARGIRRSHDVHQRPGRVSRSTVRHCRARATGARGQLSEAAAG